MDKNEPLRANNHLYSEFHIKKWKFLGGKIFDKDKNISRKIQKTDFASHLYYSLGKKDDSLEKKIGLFESYIARLIKKIDESDQSIFLFGKDIEILKLYCVLCACRHQNTTEVITDDLYGVYQSNNYLFGTPRVKTQEEAVAFTNQIIDEFFRLKKLSNNSLFFHEASPMIITNTPNFALGCHLAILRDRENGLLLSECCSLIENTMDGDHLYTYVPMSPRTAFVLVKSKYYLDRFYYANTLSILPRKHGSPHDDDFLSVIFGGCDIVNREDLLFCSYYRYPSNVHTIPNQELITTSYRHCHVKINKLPTVIKHHLNAIIAQDGRNVLYIDDSDLDIAFAQYTPYRKIK